ncbi:hypothetical protein K2173_017532 [Erythroxylum novogranatense]|uniref:Uncharacterized protein n=1 Tax=Erythroxylum novogranatense TaxID=1862640 RepID=A0AAV8TL76_9ROSI|nr:hypothetical protein K2173_017532 [Erythroxylum novogranatense]
MVVASIKYKWYLQHYGVNNGRKKKATASTKKEGEEGEATTEEVKKSNHVMRKLEKRQQTRKLDSHIEEQFGSGHLLAYMKKIQRKKGKGADAA